MAQEKKDKVYNKLNQSCKSVKGHFLNPNFLFSHVQILHCEKAEKEEGVTETLLLLSPTDDNPTNMLNK